MDPEQLLAELDAIVRVQHPWCREEYEKASELVGAWRAWVANRGFEPDSWPERYVFADSAITYWHRISLDDFEPLAEARRRSEDQVLESWKVIGATILDLLTLGGVTDENLNELDLRASLRSVCPPGFEEPDLGWPGYLSRLALEAWDLGILEPQLRARRISEASSSRVG